jgi:uncharacterized protein (UPF0335 family)
MGFFSHTDKEHLSEVLNQLKLEKHLIDRLEELEKNETDNFSKLSYWIVTLDKLEKVLFWIKKNEPYNKNRIKVTIAAMNDAIEHIDRLEKNSKNLDEEIKEILQKALNTERKIHNHENDAINQTKDKALKTIKLPKGPANAGYLKI